MEISRNERLSSFLEYLKNNRIVYNQSDFCDIIGKPKGYISEVLSGKRGLTTALSSIVEQKFPQVNKQWLLTGEGNMLVGEEEKSDFQEKSEEGSVSAYEVPLLPISARGGTLDGFSQQVMIYHCDKIISPISGADFAIPITGDSMYPEYPSGSIVLIKKIDELAFIQWGCVFVLDTCNGVICKKIMPTDDNSVIECISINKEYPSFFVNLRDVYGIYRVLMMMSNK